MGKITPSRPCRRPLGIGLDLFANQDCVGTAVLEITVEAKVTRVVATMAVLLGLSLFSASGQATNSTPATNAASAPADPPTTNAPPAAVTPGATNSPAPETNAAPPPAEPTPPPTAPMPPPADFRPLPDAVKASHPELATVSPIATNSRNPRALDLETCFKLTAVRDDSLKISMQDINVAKAQMSQAIAALWPVFTVSNQQEFVHYDQGAPKPERNYTSQSHVDMSFTIFNGGQNWNAVGAGDAAIAAKRQTLARDYQTIYQDVAQAFYQVLQYQGDLAIQQDLIGALQARMDDLKGRVSLGRSRPSELLQSQTDLANAKVTAEAQKGSLNAAKETLAFYIGIPSSQFELKETQSFPSVARLEWYLGHSVARPDVLAQVETLRQAERQLSAAKGAFLPTITANGDFLASQDPDVETTDATMTLEISMPIFDGGLILGKVNQNKAFVRQSALDLEQLKRTADQNTRTAYANFNSSAAQVVVLREVAVLAAKSLKAQVDDYLRGVVSNLDVLTALKDYQTAREQLHDSNMQARLNLISLHVAAGTAATGPGAGSQALPATKGTVTTTGTAK